MKNVMLCSALALLLPLLICFKAQAATMISAESSTIMNLSKAAAYCRDLSAACEVMSDGSKCGADAYADWRLPAADELSSFVGLTSSENYYWTTTPYQSELNTYIVISLADGSWGYGGYSAQTQVRCVR